ncbi:MAG: hypothetical protein IJL17_06905 [Kiritimatiellae bacterium]|nr:hypothetical protein [Kiritimatiellia bacterium]
MAFIDLEELKQDAEDEGIVPHPLKDVLSASKKAAYIKGIVFAGFVDDDRLQNDEEKFSRARALSLDMSEAEFKEALADVKALPKEGRSAFLKEVLGEFKDDRAASFYFVSDLALAMASDGDLTPGAVSFLESVYSLLKLSPIDIKFLSDYRVFLAPGRMAEAGELLHKATQDKFDLPDGFVRFFTPELNPIPLKAGECQSHALNICSAKFQLDGELIIPKSTTLVMKDAEIRFGRAGKLTLSGSKIEIRNCRFVVPSKTAEGSDQSATHFICGKDLASLELTGCTFDGAMERGAVETDGTLIIKECVFCNLKSEEPTVSAKEQFTCTLSEFKNCQCTKHAIVSVNQNVSVTICRFERCKACSWLDMKRDYPSDFNVSYNLFDRFYASCDFCYVAEKTTADHALYGCCFQEVEYKELSTGFGYSGSFRFMRNAGISVAEFEKIFKNKGVAENT